ncbi:hypothetical protein EDB85DRAFT_2148195 [Lactarius pseudohatsudake]|nr:hypothetical protein EDB85DRAFT_2148195 [Lactarius pseudohatsudake]
MTRLFQYIHDLVDGFIVLLNSSPINLSTSTIATRPPPLKFIQLICDVAEDVQCTNSVTAPPCLPRNNAIYSLSLTNTQGTARANKELAEEGIPPPFGLSRLIRLVITLRRQSLGLFNESKFLAELMFRRVIDLEELLRCLAAELNMEYLVFLDSLPYMFRPSTWSIVTHHGLKEVHWFQGCVYDNVLRTVKLFEHLIPSSLDSPELALLLDPTKLLLMSSVRVDLSDLTLTSTLPYPGTTSPSAPGALLPLHDPTKHSSGKTSRVSES